MLCQLLTILLGTGTLGSDGDGSAATNAQLNSPYDLSVDLQGNVFIADRANNRIRKLTLSTGLMSTIAGRSHSVYSYTHSFLCIVLALY